MDFALTEEQEMLRKSARDFLTEHCPKTFVKQMEEDEKGYSPDLWRQMAELGWLGLAFPQKYGGSDMSFLDLAVLLEEMGRACLPGPFFSTVVLGGLPVLDAASEQQKQSLLPKMISGDLMLTLALTEANGAFDPASISFEARQRNDEFLLSGDKLFVPDGHLANLMLVVTRTAKGGRPEDGVTVFLVDAGTPGTTCIPLKTIAGDKLFNVRFDDVRVPAGSILGQPNAGWKVVERLLQKASVAKCCEVVGAAQQVLEMTLDYAKTRVQFGKPIGSFQAMQLHCADMAIDVDGTRFIAYKTAWMLGQGIPCAREAAIAKAWTSDAYRRIVSLGHAVYGALGITMDADLQFYTRRAKAAELAFGDTVFQREKIAQLIGL